MARGVNCCCCGLNCLCLICHVVNIADTMMIGNKFLHPSS
jgi:hypothetical protein